MYKRQTQDIIQIREENKEEIARVRTDIGERMEGVYNNMNNIDSQASKNKEKIEELRRRELQLQEEVDSWRDRPRHSIHTTNSDNR